MSLIKEYEDICNKFIPSDIINLDDKKKISGNITSCFLKNLIEEFLVGTNYKLSVVNSYIKGCSIEWDLLILKSPSIDEIKYNIYDAQNVVAALEFKTSGAKYTNDPEGSCEYIFKYENVIDDINKKFNTNIKYGYISLCEIPNNLIAMKEKFSNCFWIYEGWYPHNNFEKDGIKTIEEFKDFIFKLII